MSVERKLSMTNKWLKISVFSHDIAEFIVEEEKGLSEYRRLLDKVDDPEIKSKIEEIVKDEEKHLEILKSISYKLGG